MSAGDILILLVLTLVLALIFRSASRKKKLAAAVTVPIAGRWTGKRSAVSSGKKKNAK